MRVGSHAAPSGAVLRLARDVLSLGAALTNTEPVRRGARTPYRRPSGRRDGSTVMKIAYVVVASPVAVTMLLGAALSTDVEQAPSSTVDTSSLPTLARGLLPDLDALRARDCPQLPLVWLLALVQVESGWNPRAYSSAGAAGLLQLLPASWAAATGGRGWDVRAGPPADSSVWEPRAHLAAAVPWVC